MTVTFHNPNPADAETMAGLLVGSMRESYQGIVPSEVLAKLSVPDLAMRWKGYLEDRENLILLAKVGDEPAGLIRAGTCKEPLQPVPDGHVFNLYVLRSFYRRGIGRGLLGKVASHWLAKGGRSLSVGVLTSNDRATAFYEAMGARRVLETSFEWDGHSLPESLYLFDNLPELSHFA